MLILYILSVTLLNIAYFCIWLGIVKRCLNTRKNLLLESVRRREMSAPLPKQTSTNPVIHFSTHGATT